MDNHKNLDTKLYTRFAIFIWAFRLERALLTRRVVIDAADAERFVTFHRDPEVSKEKKAGNNGSELTITSEQSTEAGRVTSFASTIRERRRTCWRTDQVQLCLGMFCCGSSVPQIPNLAMNSKLIFPS